MDFRTNESFRERQSAVQSGCCCSWAVLSRFIVRYLVNHECLKISSFDPLSASFRLWCSRRNIAAPREPGATRVLLLRLNIEKGNCLLDSPSLYCCIALFFFFFFCTFLSSFPRRGYCERELRLACVAALQVVYLYHNVVDISTPTLSKFHKWRVQADKPIIIYLNYPAEIIMAAASSTDCICLL